MRRFRSRLVDRLGHQAARSNFRLRSLTRSADIQPTTASPGSASRERSTRLASLRCPSRQRRRSKRRTQHTCCSRFHGGYPCYGGATRQSPRHQSSASSVVTSLNRRASAMGQRPTLLTQIGFTWRWCQAKMAAAPRCGRQASARARVCFSVGLASRPRIRPTSIWTARSPAGQMSSRPSANSR